MILCRRTDSSSPPPPTPTHTLSFHFSQRALINTKFNNSVLYSNSLPAYQTQSDCW